MPTSEQSTTPSVPIDDFMRMMDVVDAKRRLESQVEKELDHDSMATQIKQQLREAYAKMGVQVSEDQLTHALEDHFSRRYAFQQPAKNFQTTLARAYINRRFIALCTGVPLAAFLGVTALTKGYIYLEAHSQEAAVERSLQDYYAQSNTLEGILKTVSTSSELAALPQPESAFVQSSVIATRQGLEPLLAFLHQYCPDGDATVAVTPENYASLRLQLDPFAASLQDANATVDKIQTVFLKQSNLTTLHTSLDALLGQIVAMDPPQNFRTQAQQVYDKGILSVQQRELTDGETYFSQLSTLKKTVEAFKELIPKTEQIYASIQRLVKEQAAEQQAKKLYQQGQQLIQQGDAANLQQVAADLRDLEGLLSSEYTFIITGGKWRYSVDNPSARNYYLLVQAHDSRGQQLPQRIKNEEDNSITTVTEWGERVSEAVYERVKADKLDNDIIENNLYGKKLKGYTSFQVLFTDPNGQPLSRTGQITRW